MPSISPVRTGPYVLELCPSRGALLRVAVVPAFAGLPMVEKVVWPRNQVSFILAVGCLALVLGVTLLSVIAALRTRPDEWRVRLDADGVTVRGHATIPWSDLAEVRRVKVWVSFVPRPGVELPTVPTALAVWPTGARRRSLVKRFGGPVVVNTNRVGVPPDRITAAARALGNLPVSVA